MKRLLEAAATPEFAKKPSQEKNRKTRFHVVLTLSGKDGLSRTFALYPLETAKEVE